MKAVLFGEHGDSSVLSTDEVDKPEIESDEVLVKVEATSVNHIDIHMRRGVSTMGIDLPHIPGSDIAGTVAETGEDVDSWREGERVVGYPVRWCGDCEYCLRGEHSMCDSFKLVGEHINGAYAEYVKVPAKNLIELPKDVGFTTGAGAGLVYMTAWRMAITNARVEPGDRVLITGASGGVGSAAVDICRRIGAEIYATAGTEPKKEFVKERGADEVINYRVEDVAKSVRSLGKVDVVLDSVGEELWMDILKSTRKGGKIVTCGATTGWNPDAGLNYIFYNQLNITGSTMCSLTEARKVMNLVFEGDLNPTIDRILDLENASEAHENVEKGNKLGKIVLDV